MRHVLRNSSEVFHLWANRSQEYGRAASVSFNGPTLYSYAAPIARHVTNAQGESAVIHATRRWSVTTSGHQSAARSASHHIRSLFVCELAPGHVFDPREALADADRQIDNAILDTKEGRTARGRAKRWETVHGILRRRNDIAEFFGLPARVLSADADAAVAAVERELTERQRKADARHKRELAKAKREALARLEEWKRGEHESLPCAAALGCDYMRLIEDGATVETTRGAYVPVDDLRRVAPVVLACIRGGRHWHRNGQTINVGHYSLDAITSDGTVIVGCHRFQRSEIERMAGLLGL